MIVLNSLLLCLALAYGLFVAILIFSILRPGKKNISMQENASNTPPVSIVIPFRNEACNLPELLQSLGAQTYKGTVEIILVNDGSTDDYTAAMPPEVSPVRVLDAQYDPAIRLTPKQQALQLGIAAAQHDWIALTDADMVLDSGWLASLMAQARKDTAMVFGHTVKRARGRDTLFSWFQSFQLETLFSTAYAFNRSGLIGSCMGNNLLISKKAFLELGGYRAMGYSMTEDCDLLVAFRKKKLCIATTDPFIPTATTAPCATVGGFYRQMLRWAKGGFGKNPHLAVAGVLLGAQNILFLLALAGVLGGAVSLVVFCNLLLTWLFLAIVFRKTGSQQHPLHFWPFYLLFLLESAILGFGMLFRQPVVWKERSI